MVDVAVDLLSILACLRARVVSCRCNRAGVSPDSGGIPSEDRLTIEDKHGLTTLFWVYPPDHQPAFGSTQVRKVRGPLTEHTGTLGVISPSHCSRSPHGAGEGVSSARGLFRSW